MCGTGHDAERCVCTMLSALCALAVLDSQSSNAASRTYLNRAEHGRRPRAQPAAAVFRRCCCSGGAVFRRCCVQAVLLFSCMRPAAFGVVGSAQFR